jgi:hypothetical protein
MSDAIQIRFARVRYFCSCIVLTSVIESLLFQNQLEALGVRLTTNNRGAKQDRALLTYCMHS